MPKIKKYRRYGYNQLDPPRKSSWSALLIDILKEPMLIVNRTFFSLGI
ncbi:cation-transporting P-type ATPase [Parapedobacter koreensis]|uniref:Cation transporter/ATPase, N-terminus n=1 Tax=Parapedobacter koreensis TaxID=332977 RepID=A0A1H7U316_9SPHI|nr:cation-transporting P-type ATPase [Parapedobacter koreensis]SEL91482.1 Cation transporter/ATPase, N-terminus [Parapedobacter koreensis]